MTRVVINKCFGGFGVSDKAMEKLIIMGMKLTRYKSGNYEDPTADIVDTWDDTHHKDARKFGNRYSFLREYGEDHGRNIRTDPRLVQVVIEMGKESWGQCAELKVVEVPDDAKWHIEEYDGNEHIAQDHETWG